MQLPSFPRPLPQRGCVLEHGVEERWLLGSWGRLCQTALGARTESVAPNQDGPRCLPPAGNATCALPMQRTAGPPLPTLPWVFACTSTSRRYFSWETVTEEAISSKAQAARHLVVFLYLLLCVYAVTCSCFI